MLFNFSSKDHFIVLFQIEIGGRGGASELRAHRIKVEQRRLCQCHQAPSEAAAMDLKTKVCKLTLM